MGKPRIGSVMLGALLLVACGSADGAEGGPAGFSPSTSCGMSLAVSGAFDETIPADSAIACATQLSSGEGVEAGFLTTTGEAIDHVDLRIDAVKKDETGSGFAAEIDVAHTDQRRWTSTGCVLDVLSHAYAESDELFDYHRIAGTAVCPSPATSTSGAPELSIEAFAFVCSVPWTK